MRILVVEPQKAPYISEIDGSLESMQKVVGGYIQSIYPFDDGELALICNEEGKLEQLPLNRALFFENGEIYDIISGTFFLCSAPCDSESFASLDDEKLSVAMERFRRIEYYLF